jgi:hypothetical protein
MSRTAIAWLERYPEEAAVIGRLLTGYGEIEFELAHAVGVALNSFDNAIRLVFRVRNESQRLEVADAILRPFFAKIELSGQYGCALGAARHCKAIRNQYAHCHWYSEEVVGLYFTNLEEAAKRREGETSFNMQQISLPLLKEQEAYFIYAQDCLVWLRRESYHRLGLEGPHGRAWPTALRQPSLDNHQD